MGPRYNRVAVIGAGISGMVSASYLKAEGIDVVVFERSKTVGGVWVLDPRRPLEPKYPSTKPIDETLMNWDNFTSPDVVEEILDVDSDEKEKIFLQHAPPGPCYEGLMNNVPTPLMEIKNQEWPAATPDFVKHDIINTYIQQVPIRLSLHNVIRFNTRVSKLWKTGTMWRLESIELRQLSSGKLKKMRRVDEFDAVVIASGHYDLPSVPDIPGLGEWKARFPTKVQHSKSYRRPDEFAGQNVLLIGAGASAMDIAKELGPVAKSVVQVTRGGRRDLPVVHLPQNGKRVGPIRSFNLDEESSSKNSDTIPGKVILDDGVIIKDIHRVIVCTGYHMSYPFLRDLHTDKRPEDLDSDEYSLVGCPSTQTNNLHKDIWYIVDPSLAFIGVPYYTATFSLFDIQAMVLSKVFAGKVDLPSRATMREEYLQRLQMKGHGRDFHNLAGEEIEYAKELVQWVNRDLSKLGESPIEGHSAKWHDAWKKQMEKMPEFFRIRKE